MGLHDNIFKQIIHSQQYKKNILYGEPRPGHPEGTVKAHIAELETNLALVVKAMYGYDGVAYMKLKILIHVHDLFKADAKRNSPILDPQSHASLARAFLAGTYADDQDLLNMVQYHDIGFAVYKKYKQNTKQKIDEERLKNVLDQIKDINLFTTFVIIDSCTPNKDREAISWFVDYVADNYPLDLKIKDLLNVMPQSEVKVGAY